MIITRYNIQNVFPAIKEAFLGVSVREYSGWEDQVSPFRLIEDEPEELAFCKEYAGNIWENSFVNIELDSLGNEKFIRFISREYDEFDNTVRKNFVIEEGMEIFVNWFDKQIIIIEPNSPLRKLVKKDKSIRPFTVFLFPEKERLEKLAKKL